MFFFMFFLFFMFLIFFLFFVFIVLFVMFFSFFLFFMLLFFIVLFFVFFTLQEDLPVHLNDIGGMSEGLKMLAQPFKLKLQRADGETALRDYSQNVVRPCQSRTLPVAEVKRCHSQQLPRQVHLCKPRHPALPCRAHGRPPVPTARQTRHPVLP